MTKEISTNPDQRLYIIPCTGGGFTCLGFDVLERWLAGYVQHIAQHRPNAPLASQPAPIGSVERYAQYEAALDIVRDIYETSGRRVRCESQLSPQLKGLEGHRVEVIDGAGEAPRRFIVGKSTGFVPIHLEIERRRDSGGCGAMSLYHSVKDLGAVS